MILPRLVAFPVLALFLALSLSPRVGAIESIPLWNGPAPGETTQNPGTPKPGGEDNVTRIENVTQPTLDLYGVPAKANDGKPRPAVLVIPGGGFYYVVPDLEGSEPAEMLEQLGIATVVLRYRTRDGKNDDQAWRRPLQDAQRAMSLLRSKAAEWNIDPQRIGTMGFSAGGQTAARLITAKERTYQASDAVDRESHRPDFGMLVYPWRLLADDAESMELTEGMVVDATTPPTWLVHTQDDHAADPLGSMAFYAAMTKHKIPGELFIYQSGGHGYGIRPRPNSVIHTWGDRAADWLRKQKLTAEE